MTFKRSYLPYEMWWRVETRYPAWRRERYPLAEKISNSEWRALYGALDREIDSWGSFQALKAIAFEVMAYWVRPKR